MAIQVYIQYLLLRPGFYFIQQGLQANNGLVDGAAQVRQV